MDATPERWLPVVGWESLYEVSDQGRIRSMRTGRIMRPGRLPTGYKYFGAHGRGKTQNHYVHRVVLEAFIGPCPEGMECCHNDGNPQNNRLENLRWDTKTNNGADTRRHGTARNQNTDKAYCGNGHEFAPGNTYVNPQGGRTCLTCRREYQRAYRRNLRIR